jgi:hypothetical protein
MSKKMGEYLTNEQLTEMRGVRQYNNEKDE